MNKLLHLFVVISLILLSCLEMNAQTSLLYTDFSNGIPSSWGQSPNNPTYSWGSANNGVGSLTPYYGSSYALLSSDVIQSPVKLVTPMLTISAVENPVLSFWFAQPESSTNVFDNLKIYYRTSYTSSWSLLIHEDEVKNYWQYREIGIDELSTFNIQFAFEYNYNQGIGIAIDKIYVGSQSLCTTPTNLRVPSITSSTANLTWAASYEAESFKLKVSTAPILDMMQTSDVLDVIVYNSPYLVTGLNASEYYYFYVKSICDSDESDWSEQGTFRTACNAFSLPLVENFEACNTVSSIFNTCWTKYAVTINWSSNSPTSSLTPQCNDGSLIMSCYYYPNIETNDASISRAIVTTPEIDTPDITATQISFKASSESTDAILYVGLMSDPLDPSTFIEAAAITMERKSVEEEFIIPFDQISNVSNSLSYVAFLMDGSDGVTASISISEINLNIIPPCPKPSFVRATNIKHDSAILSWSSSKASSWDMKISTTPMTDFSLNADIVNLIGMTTNPYQIANLQELTEYYVYVKSNCGSLDGVSEWSSAYSFTTRCNPITNYPYRYNFDDDVHATFPICWSSLNSYNNYPNVQQGTYVVSPGSLHFISDGIKYQYALTPAIGSSMDALQVSFSLRPLWQNTSGTFEVGIMSDPNDTSTFELIKRIEPKREDVVNYEIPLIRSLTDGTNNHIAFRHLSGQILSQQGAFFLDDVIVDSLPPCIAPLDIQLLKLDSHEVIIGWESVKQESQWNIKVSATQLSDPSNTITGIMYNLTTNVDTFRMTNLSVGTTYYIYIQSVCQDDLSKWREFEVDIPCSEGISILPFIESFNGYETGESPNCWIKTAGNPVVNFGFNSTDALNSGSLYMFTSPGINTAIMTLPELNVSGLSVHDLQVSFSFIATGAGHAAILGVMTDPTDESTFEAIDTFYAEKSYEFYKVIDISLASYQGNGTFIAFKSQIGFGALYSNVIYIDDITIEQIPTCKRIIDININELSNDFASIEWTPRDNSSNWELVIGAIGFDPNDAVVIEVANPNHTFNNLTALTAYQVYIRTDCGNNDKSQWSLPINFVTTPIPTNLPWSTNFSDDNDNALWQIINGNQTNKWIIGTNTQNSGTKSLYIATGLEVVNNYDSYSESAVYASRMIRFTPGIYQISFDWKGNGNVDDFARVALVESTVELTPGSTIDLLNANVLPKGWVYDLGEGLLYGQTSWTNKTKAFSISEEKNYQLVVFWANNYYGNYQPPFAIDNIEVVALQCAPAIDIEVEAHDTFAIVTWNNATLAPKFEIALFEDFVEIDSLENFNDAVIYDSVFINTITLNDLKPFASYVVYIRTYCEDNSTMQWTKMQFSTECTSIKSLPYLEDFENYGVGMFSYPDCWTRVVTDGYNPYVSSTVNHSLLGNGSIYLIAYKNSVYGNSYSMIASPQITALPISDLNASFWYNGTGEIVVGVMTDVNDENSFESVDTIYIYNYNKWFQVNVSFANYQGDGQYIAIKVGGTNSVSVAVYIDDFVLTDNRTCATPEGLYVSRVTTDAAKLNWSAITELTTYTIKFADFDFDPEKQYNDVVTISECSSTYYDMTDLETDTEYFFYVKADCDSYWSKVAKFRTECDILSIPYSESFHEFDLTLEELPSCWRYQNVMSGWVTKNCIPTLISNSNCSEAPYALKLASFLDNDITGDYNAIETALYLPKFNKELDKLYIKFSAYALEKESFVKVGSVTEVYDQSTFNVIAEIELSQNCQEYVVSFDASTTNDGYITLLLEDQTLTMYISDILVDTFEYCQPVTLLYDTDLTESSVSIHWSPMSQQDSLWQLMITDVEIINVNQFDTLTSLLVDTIIQGVNIDLLNLDANTSYYYTIRAVCGENDYGYFYPYVRSFRTPCVDLQIPYVEVFDNLMLETALPACWSSYKGTFDQVISTGEFTSESNSWLQRDTFGLVGTHMVVPITWNNFEWLISAPVEIDTTTIVSFDLARTNQGGGSAPSSRRPMNDDRMIFVVSTDGGETWDIENQIVWNDNAYMPGSHSFAAIPPTGQNYIVDLSRYMNQTIRVAFYVESTMGDYSLDFHLGNVKFVNLPSKVINDLSCENRDYNDNGFAIPANELEFSGHYMYRRTFVNENGLDSMIVLDLTVMPNVKNTINVMICEGETYNLNGFNESLSGVYYNYLPSSLGCDSILELYLVVMSDTIFESKVTICESELPYAWNNNLYTISGRYLDTLSSSLGCDSIVSLELNVLETNHTTVAQTIFSNDLPYEYNGYIFDENTPLGITTYIFRGLDMNGCDSTHTINLNVMDTTTNGQFDITENFFELYPNPINRYGEVTLNANFTETELSNGLTVEVFNAVGECVNTIRPTALPIRIDGFDASGVYIVRVTTSENRIEYGKVVVR